MTEKTENRPFNPELDRRLPSRKKTSPLSLLWQFIWGGCLAPLVPLICGLILIFFVTGVWATMIGVLLVLSCVPTTMWTLGLLGGAEIIPETMGWILFGVIIASGFGALAFFIGVWIAVLCVVGPLALFAWALIGGDLG